MVSNKKLDAVLEFIRRKTELNVKVDRKYIWQFYIEPTPELGIDEGLLDDILSHLLSEGYITMNTTKHFSLTIKGRNFKGYDYTTKWYRKEPYNKAWFQLLLTVVAGLIVLVAYDIIFKKNTP